MMTMLKTNMTIRALIMAFSALALSACGSIIDTGQDTIPDTIFDLEPRGGASAVNDPVMVYMENPSFPAFINTIKIAVKPGGQEIQYLAGARWSDSAPSLIARHLVISLENTGRYGVLTNQNPALPHELRLLVDIRDFSAHIRSGQPQAVAEFEITLINAKTLDVMGLRTFRANVNASENSKAAIAAAFQQALDNISNDLEGWLNSAN